MSKQYGLIVPGKNKGPTGIQRPSIFNDDSDSDGQTSAKPTGLTKNLKRQDREVQQKAVQEDPTVYQYDELYDEMESKRNESKLSRKDLERKPKYISKLLQAAERRKRENERRIEKQVQKEREQEGEEFKDKESFVTTSYRKKLEEMRELDEQERREEYLESIGDVRKQGNLDGFYRHLYDQKVNYDENIKKEPTDPQKQESNEPMAPEIENASTSTEKVKHKRKYRKRASDSESDKSEPETEVKMEHLPSNLDADSDFSIDSSDSEGEDVAKSKDGNVDVAKPAEGKTAEVTTQQEVVEDKKEVKEDKDVEVEPKKPKIDIWKKRTVGIVFEEALQRYFERKALREAGNGG